MIWQRASLTVQRVRAVSCEQGCGVPCLAADHDWNGWTAVADDVGVVVADAAGLAAEGAGQKEMVVALHIRQSLELQHTHQLWH